MSYNLSDSNSGYLALTAGGLAAGNTASQLKTVNTITYLNNGVFKSKTAVAAISLTGLPVIAAGKAALIGVFLDGAGNVSTAMGPIVDSADPCPVPTAPAANLTVVGLAKVQASSVFTPGTTSLGTGNTATYFDVASMPGTAL